MIVYVRTSIFMPMHVYFYSPTVLSKCMASKLCLRYLFSQRTRSRHICLWPVACGLSASPRALARTAPRHMAEWNSDMEVDVLYQAFNKPWVDRHG